jgi:2-oxoglutarate ferredoxin oxidoreductase subunit alpha
VQGEDELASIGIVIGASWNGARAFTATSGPGISLMTEFIGLSYFAEIPAVIMNIQRAGPSTGMPTRTQQCDIIACAYASHGDTKHCPAVPGRPGRSVRVRGAVVRPRRSAADHDLPDARPRHRHEPPAVPSAEVGRRPAV